MYLLLKDEDMDRAKLGLYIGIMITIVPVILVAIIWGGFRYYNLAKLEANDIQGQATLMLPQVINPIDYVCWGWGVLASNYYYVSILLKLDLKSQSNLAKLERNTI